MTSLVSGDDVAAVQNTLKKVFLHVRTFSLRVVDGLTSIVFVAADNPVDFAVDGRRISDSQEVAVRDFLAGELIDLQSDVVLSDDFNPLDHQRRRVQLLWRQEMRDYLGDRHLQWLLL